MGHYHGNQRKNINNGYTQIRMTMCRQNAILLGNIIPTTDSLNVSFFSISFLITYVVYTDGLKHTARSFGASLPLVSARFLESRAILCSAWLRKVISQKLCQWGIYAARGHAIDAAFEHMILILSSCSVHRNKCTPWPCSVHCFFGIYIW